MLGCRRTPIENCQPTRSSRVKIFLFQNPESARSSFRTGGAGTRHARDQLVGEPGHPAGGVGRAGAQPDLDDLAAVGAGGQDWVIAPHARVAERRALLTRPEALADERLD